MGTSLCGPVARKLAFDKLINVNSYGEWPGSLKYAADARMGTLYQLAKESAAEVAQHKGAFKKAIEYCLTQYS